MRFAVVDLGGSFIKSALIEASAMQLTNAHRTPFPPFVPTGDPAAREVDLQQIRVAFEEHVDRLIGLEPGCAGLLVSTQMHGFVLLDEAQKPATNFISWQDQRSTTAERGSFREASDRLDERAMQQIGREAAPGHPASVLFHMIRTGTLPRGRTLTPVALPNALLAPFATEPTTDETLAASFGTYDVAAGEWSSAVLSTLGLDSLNWPRVTRWSEPVAAYRTGSVSLPVYSPIGDQQAALLGSLLTAGELSLNIGTGSQVSTLSNEPRLGNFKVRPWPGGGFLETVTHIPAGRALNVLVRFAREISGADVHSVWSAIDRMIDETPATDLVVDLAFFPSAFGSTGGIANIHESNFSAGQLFLAAYENMAANYLEAARRLRPSGGWGPLVFSGGLAHRAGRLRQIVAAKLDRVFRLSPSEDETLAGLGSLARVVSGLERTPVEATAAVRQLTQTRAQ